MDSLVYGEHERPKVAAGSSLKRSCSLPKFTDGTGFGDYISPAHSDFITVVQVDQTRARSHSNASGLSDDFITVLEVGCEPSPVGDRSKVSTLIEQVTVYRLPGERLGMALKFEGGADPEQTVDNLYIQSINQESPASRIQGAILGRLCEGDELLEINGKPVNSMTRIECVAALKDVPVCFKMLIRRQDAKALQVNKELNEITCNGSSHYNPNVRNRNSANHKSTLQRVNSENGLSSSSTLQRLKRGPPPPVPPRMASTSLTSSSSFRCSGKSPLHTLRRRPSQPPPLPPRRSDETTLSGTTAGSPDVGTRCCKTSSTFSSLQLKLDANHSPSVESNQEQHQFNGEERLMLSLPVTQCATSNHVNGGHVDHHSNNCSSVDSEPKQQQQQRLSNMDSDICLPSLPPFQPPPPLPLPPPPECYLDSVSMKKNWVIESESDDTGSSVSTVIERFSRGSTANSSFSDHVASRPQGPSSLDIGLMLSPFEKLEREFDQKKSPLKISGVNENGERKLLDTERGKLLANITDYHSLPVDIRQNEAKQELMPLTEVSQVCPSKPDATNCGCESSKVCEINLDDYDDIQSVSMNYHEVNGKVCESIVDPPTSFSNHFESIVEERGEQESNQDGEGDRKQKLRGKCDDVGIGNRDTVNSNCIEAKIVEQLATDNMIGTVACEAISPDHSHVGDAESDTNKERLCKPMSSVADSRPPVKRELQLPACNASASSAEKCANKQSGDSASVRRERGHSPCSGRKQGHQASAINGGSSDGNKDSIESQCLSGKCDSPGNYSTMKNGEEKKMMRSPDATEKVAQSNGHKNTLLMSPVSLIPKMLEPHKLSSNVLSSSCSSTLSLSSCSLSSPLTSSSALYRRSKSTFNLSTGEMDCRPSLIPRPIMKQSAPKPSNRTTTKIPVRRSKSIENMRSIIPSHVSSSSAIQACLPRKNEMNPKQSKLIKESSKEVAHSASLAQARSHSCNIRKSISGRSQEKSDLIADSARGKAASLHHPSSSHCPISSSSSLPLLSSSNSQFVVDQSILNQSILDQDDMKEMEELEEFIQREMKCKESDDFLAEELFKEQNLQQVSPEVDASSEAVDTNGTCEANLSPSFPSNSLISSFPTIPEEQEDPNSLESPELPSSTGTNAACKTSDKLEASSNGSESEKLLDSQDERLTDGVPQVIQQLEVFHDSEMCQNLDRWVDLVQEKEPIAAVACFKNHKSHSNLAHHNEAKLPAIRSGDKSSSTSSGSAQDEFSSEDGLQFQLVISNEHQLTSQSSSLHAFPFSDNIATADCKLDQLQLSQQQIHTDRESHKDLPATKSDHLSIHNNQIEQKMEVCNSKIISTSGSYSVNYDGLSVPPNYARQPPEGKEIVANCYDGQHSVSNKTSSRISLHQAGYEDSGVFVDSPSPELVTNGSAKEPTGATYIVATTCKSLGNGHAATYEAKNSSCLSNMGNKLKSEREDSKATRRVENGSDRLNSGDSKLYGISNEMTIVTGSTATSHTIIKDASLRTVPERIALFQLKNDSSCFKSCNGLKEPVHLNGMKNGDFKTALYKEKVEKIEQVGSRRPLIETLDNAKSILNGLNEIENEFLAEDGNGKVTLNGRTKKEKTNDLKSSRNAISLASSSIPSNHLKSLSTSSCSHLNTNGNNTEANSYSANHHNHCKVNNNAASFNNVPSYNASGQMQPFYRRFTKSYSGENFLSNNFRAKHPLIDSSHPNIGVSTRLETNNLAVGFKPNTSSMVDRFNSEPIVASIARPIPCIVSNTVMGTDLFLKPSEAAPVTAVLASSPLSLQSPASASVSSCQLHEVPSLDSVNSEETTRRNGKNVHVIETDESDLNSASLNSPNLNSPNLNSISDFPTSHSPTSTANTNGFQFSLSHSKPVVHLRPETASVTNPSCNKELNGDYSGQQVNEMEEKKSVCKIFDEEKLKCKVARQEEYCRSNDSESSEESPMTNGNCSNNATCNRSKFNSQSDEDSSQSNKISDSSSTKADDSASDATFDSFDRNLSPEHNRIKATTPSSRSVRKTNNLDRTSSSESFRNFRALLEKWERRFSINDQAVSPVTLSRSHSSSLHNPPPLPPKPRGVMRVSSVDSVRVDKVTHESSVVKENRIVKDRLPDIVDVENANFYREDRFSASCRNISKPEDSSVQNWTSLPCHQERLSSFSRSETDVPCKNIDSSLRDDIISISSFSASNHRNSRSISVSDIRRVFENHASVPEEATTSEVACNRVERPAKVDEVRKIADPQLFEEEKKVNGLQDSESTVCFDSCEQDIREVTPRVSHSRVLSSDSTVSDCGNSSPEGISANGCNSSSIGSRTSSVSNLRDSQFGSVTSLASTTSLISPQELQALIDEANQSLEGEVYNQNANIQVIVLHREYNTSGSIGITLAGGSDYETKEIIIHKVIKGSIADRDGRIKKGDRVLSINGKILKGATHKEALKIMKSPRPEVVIVISRNPTAKNENGFESCGLESYRTGELAGRLRSEEEMDILNSSNDGNYKIHKAALVKDGAGLGFILEGGRDSVYLERGRDSAVLERGRDKPLAIKRIFKGGPADKEGTLWQGDELIFVNDMPAYNMTRTEAWNYLKKLPDGVINITVRRRVYQCP